MAYMVTMYVIEILFCNGLAQTIVMEGPAIYTVRKNVTSPPSTCGRQHSQNSGCESEGREVFTPCQPLDLIKKIPPQPPMLLCKTV